MPEKTNTARKTDKTGEIVRQSNGRFVKGAPSPNPGGRQKRTEEEKAAMRAAQEIINMATPEAAKLAVQVLRDKNEKTETRLKVAMELLDRGLGKAVQAVELDTDNTIRVEISKMLGDVVE